MLQVVVNLVNRYSTESATFLRVALSIVGMAATAVAWFSAYRRGQWRGVLAVALAFFGGIVLGMGNINGAWPVGGGLALGLVWVRR